MAATVTGDVPSGSRRGVTRTPKFMEWQREINNTRPRKRSERDDDGDGADATPMKRAGRRASSEEEEETEKRGGAGGGGGGGAGGSSKVEEGGTGDRNRTKKPLATAANNMLPHHRRRTNVQVSPAPGQGKRGKEGAQMPPRGGEKKGGGSGGGGGGAGGGKDSHARGAGASAAETGGASRQVRGVRRGSEEPRSGPGAEAAPGSGSRKGPAVAAAASPPSGAMTRKGKRLVAKRGARLPRASDTPQEEDGRLTRRTTLEKAVKNIKSKRVAQREEAPSCPPLKMPRLHLVLTKKEVNEDWISITGHKYVGKPKKSTLLQRGLGLCTSLVAPSSIRYLTDPQ